MKLHHLALAVCIAGALASVAYLLSRPSTKPPLDARVGEPLLSTDLLTSATRLRIRGENAAEVVLAKDASGPGWVVENYHSLPVDFDKLARLTRALTEAKVVRSVTRSPERLARMEFDKLGLSLEAPGANWSISVGRTVEGGGRFIRFGEEAHALETGFDMWIDTSARGWAATELTDFSADQVRSLEVRFPEGRIARFERAEPGAEFTVSPGSLLEGAQLKTEALAPLLSTLGTLRFADTTDPKEENAVAARQAAVFYTVTPFTGPVLTIEIGRKPAPPPPAAAAENAAPAPEVPTEPAQQAGPVFAFVRSSDAGAAINSMMQRRAFTVGDWLFGQLPATPDFFIATTPPAAEGPAAAGPPVAAPPPPPTAEPPPAPAEPPPPPPGS